MIEKSRSCLRFFNNHRVFRDLPGQIMITGNGTT